MSDDPDAELEAMKQKIREDFAAANHTNITPEQFREMAAYCNKMVQDLVGLFVSFQEQFKQAALAFTKLAEFLEKDAKQAERESRDTKVENVFEQDGPKDPGPISTNPNGN